MITDEERHDLIQALEEGSPPVAQTLTAEWLRDGAIAFSYSESLAEARADAARNEHLPPETGIGVVGPRGVQDPPDVQMWGLDVYWSAVRTEPGGQWTVWNVQGNKSFPKGSPVFAEGRSALVCFNEAGELVACRAQLITTHW